MTSYDDLPSEADVVVIGTGLQESVLAAACSRAGLSVLHIDRNPFYGGCWGSGFNFHSIEEWIRSVTSNSEEIRIAYEASDDELIVPAAASQSTIRDVTVRSNITTQQNPENKENCTNVAVNGRKFSIDLIPKVLLSGGSMVKVLRQSEASKYCEFKCVDRFVCIDDDVSTNPLKMLRVPCSKTEIALSSIISLIEKRLFYKFMEFCMIWHSKREEIDQAFPTYKWEDFAEKPFSEFLDSLKMRGTLKNIIMEVIGILNQNTTTTEGLHAVCSFLSSTGRLGNLPTPFVYTFYGSSELEQSFNRLCAVYGGVYCLNRPCEAFVIDKSTKRCTGIISGGQKISCKHVITSQDYINTTFDTGKEESTMKRCLVLTDKSILPSADDHITLMSLNRLDPELGMRLLETGYSANVTTKEFYFVHLSSRGDKSLGETFTPITERLFRNDENPSEDDNRPHSCWSLMFDVVQRNLEPPAENITVVPAPDYSPHLESVVSSAEDIFNRYWPDLDFLPSKAHRNNEELEDDEFVDTAEAER